MLTSPAAADAHCFSQQSLLRCTDLLSARKSDKADHTGIPARCKRVACDSISSYLPTAGGRLLTYNLFTSKLAVYITSSHVYPAGCAVRDPSQRCRCPYPTVCVKVHPLISAVAANTCSITFG